MSVCNVLRENTYFPFLSIVLVGLLTQEMSGGMALGGPLSISPLLDFRFTDATSTTVPNHGLLGSGGNATLASGTTVVSGPTPVQRLGYENAYLLIDSSSDRMYTVDIDALDTLGSFTISFFVKPVGNFGDWREMMGDTDSTTPPAFYNGWYLQGRNINGSTSPRNYAFLLVGPGSSSSVQFTSADDYIVPNTWQHLTLVVTGLQESGTHIMQVDFYRDGELFSTMQRSTSLTMGNSTLGFTIGNTHWDSSLFAQYAAVTMFGRALTAEEVRAYYNFLLTPEPPSGVLLFLALAGLGLGRRFRRFLKKQSAVPRFE